MNLVRIKELATTEHLWRDPDDVKCDMIFKRALDSITKQFDGNLVVEIFPYYQFLPVPYHLWCKAAEISNSCSIIIEIDKYGHIHLSAFSISQEISCIWRGTHEDAFPESVMKVVKEIRLSQTNK